MFSGFGLDAASVVALLGSAGVAIGLAIQGSLSNFAGGVLILLLKPFKVGDYIVAGNGNEGTVIEIQIYKYEQRKQYPYTEPQRLFRQFLYKRLNQPYIYRFPCNCRLR